MNYARQECQGMNADLLIINSAEENTFIADLLKAKGVKWGWIGLQRNTKDSTFYWIDGTPIEYDAWRSGEPNNDDGNENCAYIDVVASYGGWNDIPCDIRNIVLCQKALET